ncbi:unnamed protein product [Lathyrus sativus]|nr:unnamed protein product [Lathyrus sativus]
MAGVLSEESGVGKSVEGISRGQTCTGEALAEWRSSEQVENGIASTSPPYWDTDEDDGGPKPSELYGKYTWKIEKFSQITKRELRSNAFEVGGYKWYILIYPQGCDVCNHLSLFLCVANHDKLLPGWSHFAQFTIAVVNKDPKKSKYSDTLHRFWKKEHDWGWKKFMELSKVYDGFVDTSDNLIIKAQVQVIREKSDRPFRCLDCHYRRELVRVYLTNVEQICRRFVEERRSKLGKLIEDKARWSSFFAFWRDIDQTSRRRMSREKTDVILKVVVKHFFIEKEVTSTLVMDSLYSGLKALEGQTSKKGLVKLLDSEEITAPIVRVEKDMFVLVDDVLPLLERAAIEPLPPKDEKGPQNRTKDGNSGEDFNKDSMERDERRLTELGRRTLEIFVLAHIFSNKIEVAYQEAVALKRQEELIREEEASWQAENDQKTKRGVNEREKKSKKKQAKQKRNNRKVKDKAREERIIMAVHETSQEDNAVDEKMDSNEEAQTLSEKPDAVEDISDVSDSVDGVAEVLQPDSEDRDTSPVNWDTDASEVHPPSEASNNGISGVSSKQNGMSAKRCNSAIDDSSSTCSSDSLPPSVVMTDPYKGNTFSNCKVQKSPSRGKSRGKASCDTGGWTNQVKSQSSVAAAHAGVINKESGNGKVGKNESEGAVITLKDRLKWAEKHVVRKDEEVLSLQMKPNIQDKVVEIERLTDNGCLQKAVPSPPISPPRNSTVQMKLENKTSATLDPSHVTKTALSGGSQQTDKDPSSPLTSASQSTTESKTEIQKNSIARLTERSVARVPTISRPSSTPLVSGSRPAAPAVSMVQTSPPLARSVSAAGRLGPDPSPATHSYVPQSYRNAIMGNPATSTAASLTHSSSCSGVNPSPSYSQPSSLVSSSIFLSQSSDRMDANAVQSGVPFGMRTHDVLQNGHHWIESSQRESTRSMQYDQPSGLNGDQNHDLYRPLHSRSMGNMLTEFPACTSGRQNQALLVDEFPHLDIINDLLDDEHSIGMTSRTSLGFNSLGNGSQSLNRQFSFPGDLDANDDRGSSTSCRLERSQSYHHDHGFRGGYNSSHGHFDSLRDFIPQVRSMPYVNGHVDGLIPNQWQMAGSDLLYAGMRNTENGGYPYYPDYSNMASGVNGYNTVYRPSNGP